MESSGAGIVGLVLLISMAVSCLATDYTVGDTSGWTTGVDYTTWTSGKKFVVGDNLVFNYGGLHTVDEVSESDYKACTAGNSISSDSSGATTVALKKPGTHYFICGAMGHCGNGMKLAVTAAATAGGTPATTAPPSDTTPAVNSPPSDTTPAVKSPASKGPAENSSPSRGVSAAAAMGGLVSLVWLAVY